MGKEMKQPGPRPQWPGLLRERTPSGATRWRVRVEGNKARRIKLPVSPGERGFEEAYWKARAGIEPDAPEEPSADPEMKSLDMLVDRYLAALESKAEAGSASPLTLKGHRSLLRRAADVRDPLGRRMGALSADLPREAFVAVLDAFGPRTGAADNAVKALRAAYRWGEDRGFPADSPVFKIRKQHKGKGGAVPWTADDARRFLETHGPGTMARRWFWLAVNTMARIGDTPGFGPRHVQVFDEGRFLTWQPAKKGSAPVAVPMLPQLDEELEGAAGPTFLLTEAGRPFASPEALRNRVQKWTAAAGLDRRTQHGIRKGAARMIAEAGGSQYELMAAMSHTEAATSEVYTRSVERRKMSAEAVGRLREIRF